MRATGVRGCCSLSVCGRGTGVAYRLESWGDCPTHVCSDEPAIVQVIAKTWRWEKGGQIDT